MIHKAVACGPGGGRPRACPGRNPSRNGMIKGGRQLAGALG